MALLKTYVDLSKNISFNSAYFRLVEFRANEKRDFFVKIAVFNSAGQIPNQNLKYFDVITFTISSAHPNYDDYFSITNLEKVGMNIYKAIYLFLKTEEAFFLDSTDI